MGDSSDWLLFLCRPKDAEVLFACMISSPKTEKVTGALVLIRMSYLNGELEDVAVELQNCRSCSCMYVK